MRTNRLLSKLRALGVATTASFPTLLRLQEASDFGTTWAVMGVFASIGSGDAIAELRRALYHRHDFTAARASERLRRLRVVDATADIAAALATTGPNRDSVARFAMLVDLSLLLRSAEHPDPTAIPVVKPYLVDRKSTARKDMRLGGSEAPMR